MAEHEWSSKYEDKSAGGLGQHWDGKPYLCRYLLEFSIMEKVENTLLICHTTTDDNLLNASVFHNKYRPTRI